MTKFSRGVVQFVDDIVNDLNLFLSQPAASYCRLETAEDTHTLVADDGSLVTMIEIRGCLKLVGKEESRQITQGLTTALASALSHPGHSLQIVFHYDPADAQEEVKSLLRPTAITAKNLGLDCTSILDDWTNTLSRYVSEERAWIVLWTSPRCLPRSEAREQSKGMRKRLREGPPISRAGQQVCKLVPVLRDNHESAFQAIQNALRDLGILHVTLTTHDALWWIRHLIDPEYTSRSWRPLLPGDKLPLRGPEPSSLPQDLSGLLYPTISSQIWPREACNIGYKHLQIGDRLYAPVVMHLPPQTPKVFTGLFRGLLEERIPWRASFFVDAEALGRLGFKRLVTSLLHFTSTSNKLFNRAVEGLKKIELDGRTIVSFQGVFCTWVVGEGKADQLRRQSAILSSAIQAWGTADTREVTGDPVLGFSATLPAMTTASPAPVAVGPLDEILGMMPFSRPASPWQPGEGSFLFRTIDGKVMPFGLFSSLQASWNILGFAPMGGGKSVLLNALNLFCCLLPGQARLPHIAIIDVGSSSSGIISLLKAMLPEDQKHLAMYARLRMTKDYATNPCDTQLGCRRPLPDHMGYLVNLICLFCTPLQESAPPDGIAGLAREAVKEAYEDLADENNPRRYSVGRDTVVDELVLRMGLALDEATTWWELVDMFFDAGHIYEATRAQRFAVPLLRDVARSTNKATISDPYRFQIPSGEILTAYFVRSLQEAENAYPILAEPTRFDLGDARIISIDLDEVAKRGGAAGERQTGVMYMLARHLAAANFFLKAEHARDMPARYRAYHAKRITEIQRDIKLLEYDEFHRVGAHGEGFVFKQIVDDLETASRESRKHNLGITLFSQSMEDFPKIMVELATSILVLGGGTEQANKALTERFGLNEAARIAIGNLGKPNKAGANLVGIFRTSKGTCAQLLTVTMGHQALWAFSSTSEDREIRDALYERLGVEKTLQLLASRFPGGIKREVEKRRAKVEERGIEREKIDVIADLIEELAGE